MPRTKNSGYYVDRESLRVDLLRASMREQKKLQTENRELRRVLVAVIDSQRGSVRVGLVDLLRTNPECALVRREDFVAGTIEIRIAGGK